MEASPRWSKYAWYEAPLGAINLRGMWFRPGDRIVFDNPTKGKSTHELEKCYSWVTPISDATGTICLIMKDEKGKEGFEFLEVLNGISSEIKISRVAANQKVE